MRRGKGCSPSFAQVGMTGEIEIQYKGGRFLVKKAGSVLDMYREACSQV